MARIKVNPKRLQEGQEKPAAELRSRLSFRAVNKPGKPGYQSGMQRHHLLPRQLVSSKSFRRFFDVIGRERVGFDDFRFNGLLLPALEKAARILGLPLHRGPHPQYNEVVFQRVAQIEAGWNKRRQENEDLAAEEVLMRMRLLQAALRRSLLKPASRRIKLNKNDPFGEAVNFSDLDAMADSLWSDTETS